MKIDVEFLREMINVKPDFYWSRQVGQLIDHRTGEILDGDSRAFSPLDWYETLPAKIFRYEESTNVIFIGADFLSVARYLETFSTPNLDPVSIQETPPELFYVGLLKNAEVYKLMDFPHDWFMLTTLNKNSPEPSFDKFVVGKIL